MLRTVTLALALTTSVSCAHRLETQGPGSEARTAPTYGQYDEARRTDVLSGVPVRWTDIHSEREFWQFLYANPRAVVLFGTLGCGPCDNAKVWWQTHGAPRRWHFGFWEAGDFDTDREFQAIVGGFVSGVGRFPVATVVERAAPGRPVRGVVQASFVDYNNVTLELKQWLLGHSLVRRR